jgi:putative peptide zinc metalloprotease protein
MVSLADSMVASSSRPLGLKMRADLTARKQKYQGRTYWVVKEPVGLRYFRFQEEEFAVLNMMKGDVSLEDIKDRFEDEFAPAKITYQDLQQFVGTLHRSGLVISNAPGQGKQLKKRGDERDNKELIGKLSNVLAVRFKGIDPDRLLNLIYPYTRWLFSTTALVCTILLAASALLLVGVQFDVFQSRLPAFDSFFGPKNWLMLGVVLAVTKIIHEFGHGLLCKHFGGECHEMGVMFLVLTPCLYCNVSDSWMLPNKWHRAAIGAGGIYVEIILASIATWVWWYTDPGLVNHLALRVMFICSISTILFNGNPLLRFDGYYILSDVVEIPNLRQKATKIVQRLAGEWCLGLEMPEDPFLPQSNQFMFALYTVAAVAYRWFIFCSILFFLNVVFEPYGLKPVGQLIALMGLYGLIIQPLWQLGKFMHVPGRMDQVKWHRFSISVGIVVALIASVLFIPFPRNVKCPVQVKALDSRRVFIQVPGTLTELYVKPGDQVQAGDQLGQLSDPNFERDLQRVIDKLDELKTQRDLLQKRRALEPDVVRSIPAIEAEIESYKEIIVAKKAEGERMRITAPITGTVMSPMLRPERDPTEEGMLARWSGTPFDPANERVFMQARDEFCMIADPKKLRAILAVDQEDLPFIKRNQKVTMVFDSLTDMKIESEILQIAPREMQATDPSLSNQAGGGLATRKDTEGVDRPLSSTYQALVPLDNEHGLLKVGFRGKAKVRAGYQTLGSRIWTYLTRTFHFYL